MKENEKKKGIGCQQSRKGNNIDRVSDIDLLNAVHLYLKLMNTKCTNMLEAPKADKFDIDECTILISLA